MKADDGLADAATWLTPSVDAIGRETAEALAAAFAELSEEHREVITLARVVRLPGDRCLDGAQASPRSVNSSSARCYPWRNS